MATELTWRMDANRALDNYSSDPYGEWAIGKYYGWYLVQSLIGAHPNSASISTDENWGGYWHLVNISSGSSYVEYLPTDKSYRNSNLWGPKSFDSSSVPFMFGPHYYYGGYSPHGDQAYFENAIYNVNRGGGANTFYETRGIATLKSPPINGINYYLSVDMSINEGLSLQGPRVFLSTDISGTFDGKRRILDKNKSFSYATYYNPWWLSYLGFNCNKSYLHKVSLAISQDNGSFWFYHTYTGANSLRALFAFTGLKNYSAQDTYPSTIIQVWDGEPQRSAFYEQGPGLRGFIPRSFPEMSVVDTYRVSGQPINNYWYLDSNVISHKTTFFKMPKHDGIPINTAYSASSGLVGQILNVFDYSLSNSPYYAQSDINSQYGEMPVLIGNHGVDLNGNYKAIRGRIPDFKFATANLVQGSVRPSNGPFEYVKVGGFWCPWPTTVAASM